MSFSNANLTAPVDPGIENINLLLTVPATAQTIMHACQHLQHNSNI